MSPDLNPIEHMWGIFKRKEEKHHLSNIQQFRDVIMEECVCVSVRPSFIIGTQIKIFD